MPDPTITMTYGTYNFSPVPIVALSKTFQKAGDGTPLGVAYRMSLDGTLVAYPTGGIINIDNQQDLFVSGLKIEGNAFVIKCNNSILFSGYPRINELNFQPSPNNWVFTSPYSVELEFDIYTGSGEYSSEFEGANFDTVTQFISDAREDWSLEFIEDRSYYSWTLPSGSVLDENPYQLRLTHNVSAVGKRHYWESGLTKQPWQQAQAYVVGRLGFDPDRALGSGTINFGVGQLSPYNHIRSEAIDELGGSYSITETWILINATGATSGIAGKALEDFTISSRKASDTALTTITMEGSIVGLETRSYGNNIQPKLYNRARKIGDGISVRSLNVIPLNYSIAHNPPQGSISYTYEYNDRPSNCLTGVLSENIQIVDNYQNDVFATLTILGRSVGPVLQAIGTKTLASRDISIECVIEPPTGCGAANLLAGRPIYQVSGLIQSFYDELTGAYGQVFKQQDTSSWNPKDGRYSRNVSFAYQGCN
jgi:hypothetical protein